MKFPISNFSRNAWEQVGSHFLHFKQLPCISLKNFISLVGVTATILIALKSLRSSENRITHRLRVVHNKNTVVPKDKKDNNNNIINLNNAVIVGKTINTSHHSGSKRQI